MALIRPCADLRNNYNEISKICHETKEPIYITKNGSSDLVILSNEVYESILETEEEKIETIVEKLFEERIWMFWYKIQMVLFWRISKRFLGSYWTSLRWSW